MTRTLQAIIRKEIRENLPWAGAVFLISTIVHFGVFYYNVDQGKPLLDKQVILSCLLMYPVFGLSLGMLQIFIDLRVGRWQFVSHRPVARSQWFWGKTIAGTLLYCAAVFLPLAMLTFWASIPRVIPGPFAIDMIEPALSFVVSGLMWYAAGLLIGARKARWFGSRIMPVSLPLLGMFVAYGLAMTLGQAILIYAGFIAILMLGACSAFISSGETDSPPMWGRPTIAIGVCAGWMMLVITAMLSTGELIDRYETRGPNIAPTPDEYRSRILGANGEIVLETDSYYHKVSRGGDDQFYDLSGKPTKLPDGKLDQTDLFIEENDTSRWSRDARVRRLGFMADESHATTISFDNNEHWMYVASRRTLEGYDFASHRFVGSIGPDGFAPPGQPCRPFDGPLREQNNNGNPLIFGDEVFNVDVSRRRISRVFKASEGIEVCAAGTFLAHGGAVFVVATKNRIHFLHQQGEFASVPIEFEPRYWYLAAGVTKTGQIVLADGFNRYYDDGEATERIYDPTGKMLHRTDIPAKAERVYPDFPRLRMWEQTAAFTLSPPAFFLTLFVIRRHHWHDPLTMPIVEITGIAILFAAVAYWRLRSRHVARWRLWLWTLLSGVMGFTSVLVIPSVFTSFASVRCRSCGKQRFVNEAICKNCGTVADPPPLEGIEVLETQTA